VSLFPPATTTVTVILDGHRVSAYNNAFIASGHVYGPLRPYVTSVAEQAAYQNGVLVIRRSGRTAYVHMRRRTPDALDEGNVPLAPVLRALGAQVYYDGQDRTLVVQLPAAIVTTPTPFAGQVPPPTPVFTPTPLATPRPVWSGQPLPRRTPLPIIVPTPRAEPTNL
jgi:hypothetical protein